MPRLDYKPGIPSNQDFIVCLGKMLEMLADRELGTTDKDVEMVVPLVVTLMRVTMLIPRTNPLYVCIMVACVYLCAHVSSAIYCSQVFIVFSILGIFYFVSPSTFPLPTSSLHHISLPTSFCFFPTSYVLNPIICFVLTNFHLTHFHPSSSIHFLTYFINYSINTSSINPPTPPNSINTFTLPPCPFPPYFTLSSLPAFLPTLCPYRT